MIRRAQALAMVGGRANIWPIDAIAIGANLDRASLEEQTRHDVT
jgi:hypothetical protein